MKNIIIRYLVRSNSFPLLHLWSLKMRRKKQTTKDEMSLLKKKKNKLKSLLKIVYEIINACIYIIQNKVYYTCNFIYYF